VVHLVVGMRCFKASRGEWEECFTKSDIHVAASLEMPRLWKFTKTYERKIPLYVSYFDTVSKSCKLLKVR